MRFVWEPLAVHAKSDLVIYQSILGSPPDSRTLCGPQYLILGPEYARLRATNFLVDHNRVLVSLGGADIHNLTKPITQRVLSLGATPMAVYGPASQPEIISGAWVMASAPSLAKPLTNSCIAIMSMGMSAYEAACIGIPTALVSWTDDHEDTAKELERLGVSISLGCWDRIDWDRLDDFVRLMISEDGAAQWTLMSQAGLRLVDGAGVKRVADEIEKLL